MKNNIIIVSPTDEDSIKKALHEVEEIFSGSIQTAVFTKEIYADKIKEAVDRFLVLGCPFIHVDTFDDSEAKFEEIKQQYAHIVLIN